MKSLAAVWLLSAAFLVVPGFVRAADPPPLHLLQTLQIGGEGRWDYLTVDGPTHRLYLPRSTHVQVIDLTTGHVVADWPDTAGVHGVALVTPSKNSPVRTPGRAFVSCGKSNSVTVFDLAGNQKLAEVPTGKNPDAIVYDEASGCVLACNHTGGSVTFIPVVPGIDGKYQPQDLDVGGALEYAVVDGLGHAYVNVEDKNELVAIDTKARKVLAHYPLTGGKGPTGLAIDVAHKRLFAGCGENAQMVVLDAANGQVLSTVKIGEHVDGCAFDPISGRAYASGGDGILTVLQADAAGHFSSDVLNTEKGARTIAIDPANGRLYLPTAELSGEGRQAQMKKDTFHVLVIGQK